MLDLHIVEILTGRSPLLTRVLLCALPMRSTSVPTPTQRLATVRLRLKHQPRLLGFPDCHFRVDHQRAGKKLTLWLHPADSSSNCRTSANEECTCAPNCEKRNGMPRKEIETPWGPRGIRPGRRPLEPRSSSGSESRRKKGESGGPPQRDGSLRLRPFARKNALDEETLTPAFRRKRTTTKSDKNTWGSNQY